MSKKTATLIKDDGQICQILIQRDEDYSYFLTNCNGRIFHTVIDGKDAIIWDQDDIIDNLENCPKIQANKLYRFIQGHIIFTS